jgi:aminoglycoside/choline kinase family phosphotransferase
VTQLKGDGSDRAVFRLTKEGSSIIGIIGTNAAENRAFVSFSNHFFENGLPVAEIYATDLSLGVYLEEDLGDETLFSWMTAMKSDKGFSAPMMDMYKNVLLWLPEFQIRAGKDIDYSLCYQFKSFGYEAMFYDAYYFQNEFLNHFYRRKIDYDALHKDVADLAHFLAQAKRDYFMYRDFQSRNIMLKDEKPHFIDYQSGRLGGLQYDVASLLYEARANIPESSREELLQHYLENVAKKYSVPEAEFLTYYFEFALLRIMQALGAYGFLSRTKGKKQFLEGIPFALNNIEHLLTKAKMLQRLPYLRRLLADLVLDETLRNF